MIVVVSGEGPTDIGRCKRNTGDTCEGENFEPGAMGFFVNKLLMKIWGYSPLDAASIIYVEKKALVRRGRRQAIALPGKKRRGENTALFFKNALALAGFAIEVEQDFQCEAMAVLFRDSDDKRSAPRKNWQEKHDSMERGFAAALHPNTHSSFSRGVPMIPRPKSEVWLLCAVKGTPYQHCENLEKISGSERNRIGPKRLLEVAIKDGDFEFDHETDLVRTGVIDPAKIDMPSFNVFRNRLENVAKRMLADD